MGWNAFRLGLGSVLALTLAVPAVAAGSVTVGADMSLESQSITGCGLDPCTFANVDPGYAIPADGVIVRWRIRTSNATGEWRIRVIGLLDEGGLATGRGGGSFETVEPGAARTFETRVPVQAGDQLALDLPSNPAALELSFVDGTTWRMWNPPLIDGAPGVAPAVSSGGTIGLYNADIEPDADGDQFGDESQDKCPTDATTQGPCVPETTLTKKPKRKIHKPKAKVKFTSDQPAATFECSLDGDEFKACASPRKLKHLDEGKHKFLVRAVNQGVVDPSPAKDRFKVKLD